MPHFIERPQPSAIPEVLLRAPHGRVAASAKEAANLDPQGAKVLACTSSAPGERMKLWSLQNDTGGVRSWQITAVASFSHYCSCVEKGTSLVRTEFDIRMTALAHPPRSVLDLCPKTEHGNGRGRGLSRKRHNPQRSASHLNCGLSRLFNNRWLNTVGSAPSSFVRPESRTIRTLLVHFFPVARTLRGAGY